MKENLSRIFCAGVSEQISEREPRLFQLLGPGLVLFLSRLQFVDGIFERLLRLSHFFVLLFALLELLPQQFLGVLRFCHQLSHRTRNDRLQVGAQNVAVFPRPVQDSNLRANILQNPALSRIKLDLPQFIFRTCGFR